MRSSSIVVTLAIFLLVLAAPATRAGRPGSAGPAVPEGWPPLPPGTRTLLLLTGADLGHWQPRKCLDNTGGILYRLGLNEWLFDHAPDTDWHWISTGDVLSLSMRIPSVRPPRRIYTELARAGYDAVGVGWHDLELLGPFAIRAMTMDLPLHLVATNLRVLETGRAFFEESVVIDTASGKVGVVALLPWHEDAAWVSLEYGTVIVEPPERHLAPALRHLAGHVDTIVMIALLDEQAISRVLEELPPGTPRPDVVVAERGPFGREIPRIVADTPVLLIGGYGKILGRVSLDGAGRVLEFRGLWVKGAFPVDPRSGRVLEGLRP